MFTEQHLNSYKESLHWFAVPWALDAKTLHCILEKETF